MHLILRLFWSLPESLQFKLMAITWLLTLSFIWGVVFYASNTLLDQQQSLLMEQQLSTSRLQAAELDQKLQDRLLALQTVGLRLDPSRLADKLYVQDFLAQRFLLHSLFSGGSVIFGPDVIALGDDPVMPGRRGINYAIK